MSAYIYGRLSAQRDAATKDQSETVQAPKVSTFLDVVTALVPAEVLAANVFLISFVSTTEGRGDTSVTTINDFGTAQLIFWISIGVCLLSYLIGERSAAGEAARRKSAAGIACEAAPARREINLVRLFMPALAYVFWSMLAKSTVFPAVAPGWSEALKVTMRW